MKDKGASKQARVNAANALLDRGWGKPTQPLSGDDDAPAIQFIKRVIVDPGNRDGEGL